MIYNIFWKKHYLVLHLFFSELFWQVNVFQSLQMLFYNEHNDASIHINAGHKIPQDSPSV